MAVIDQWRTARREHRCGWKCRVPIRPGDRYLRSSVTPNDNDIGNVSWWHMPLHGIKPEDCPPRDVV